jgi:hypothetical protein
MRGHVVRALGSLEEKADIMAHTRGRALRAKEKKPWRTDGGTHFDRGNPGLSAHTAPFGLKMAADMHPIIVAWDMESVGTRGCELIGRKLSDHGQLGRTVRSDGLC